MGVGVGLRAGGSEGCRLRSLLRERYEKRVTARPLVAAAAAAAAASSGGRRGGHVPSLVGSRRLQPPAPPSVAVVAVVAVGGRWGEGGPSPRACAVAARTTRANTRRTAAGSSYVPAFTTFKIESKLTTGAFLEKRRSRASWRERARISRARPRFPIVEWVRAAPRRARARQQRGTRSRHGSESRCRCGCARAEKWIREIRRGRHAGARRVWWWPSLGGGGEGAPTAWGGAAMAMARRAGYLAAVRGRAGYRQPRLTISSRGARRARRSAPKSAPGAAALTWA